MCTEGVWMSVTPTDEELIVALDFEGWINLLYSVPADRHVFVRRRQH
jgi:hypothetical protein